MQNPPHSSRSDVAGSMRVARRAGMYTAAAATVSKSATTAAMVGDLWP